MHARVPGAAQVQRQDVSGVDRECAAPQTTRPIPGPGPAHPCQPSSPAAHPQNCRARAVETLCKPQFGALTSCLNGNNGNPAKCISQVTAFDQCTEEF